MEKRKQPTRRRLRYLCPSVEKFSREIYRCTRREDNADLIALSLRELNVGGNVGGAELVDKLADKFM